MPWYWLENDAWFRRIDHFELRVGEVIGHCWAYSRKLDMEIIKHVFYYPS